MAGEIIISENIGHNLKTASLFCVTLVMMMRLAHDNLSANLYWISSIDISDSLVGQIGRKLTE